MLRGEHHKCGRKKQCSYISNRKNNIRDKNLPRADGVQPLNWCFSDYSSQHTVTPLCWLHLSFCSFTCERFPICAESLTCNDKVYIPFICHLLCATTSTCRSRDMMWEILMSSSVISPERSCGRAVLCVCLITCVKQLKQAHPSRRNLGLERRCDVKK